MYEQTKTIVLCPLKALAHDQVNSLNESHRRRFGVGPDIATFLDSTDSREVFQALVQDTYVRLIYLCPEKLTSLVMGAAINNALRMYAPSFSPLPRQSHSGCFLSATHVTASATVPLWLLLVCNTSDRFRGLSCSQACFQIQGQASRGNAFNGAASQSGPRRGARTHEPCPACPRGRPAVCADVSSRLAPPTLAGRLSSSGSCGGKRTRPPSTASKPSATASASLH